MIWTQIIKLGLPVDLIFGHFLLWNLICHTNKMSEGSSRTGATIGTANTTKSEKDKEIDWEAGYDFGLFSEDKRNPADSPSRERKEDNKIIKLTCKPCGSGGKFPGLITIKKSKQRRDHGRCYNRVVRSNPSRMSRPVVAHGLEQRCIIDKRDHLDRLLDLHILEKIGFGDEFAKTMSRCWDKSAEADRIIGCSCRRHDWLLCAFEDKSFVRIGEGYKEQETNRIRFLLKCGGGLWCVELVVCTKTGVGRIVTRSHGPTFGEAGFAIRVGPFVHAMMNRLYKGFVMRNYEYISRRNKLLSDGELADIWELEDEVPKIVDPFSRAGVVASETVVDKTGIIAAKGTKK